MKAARPLDLRLPGREQVTLSGSASASSAFETVPDPTVADSRVNGAIFIETPFGLGRCSGTSVNAPNYSVVFTAAHCINTGGPDGRWMDFRWAFVPGYRYGQRPFGVFPAKWIDTTRQWRTTGSENFDVGAAVVGRNQRGQLLARAVGGTGIAWGLKARQVFDVHGYPAEEPFDGETQQLCAGTPFLGHDARSFLSPGPLNLAVDCDVTGGASGGGWTISGGKILNSVTNYGYGDDPDTDFGAYFGKEVGRLFHRAGRVK
jgi:V8-like Glu-specific endopeptidase